MINLTLYGKSLNKHVFIASQRLMPLLSASAFYVGCSFLLYSTYSGAKLVEKPVTASLKELLEAGPGRTPELERYLETKWGFPSGSQAEDWPQIGKYYSRDPNPLISDTIVNGYVKQLMSYEVQHLLKQEPIFPDKLTKNNVRKLLTSSNGWLLQAKLRERENETRSTSATFTAAYGASKSSDEVKDTQRSPETFGEDTVGLDFSSGRFFAVADGVGGAENSEVLSRVAVKAVESFISHNSRTEKIPMSPKLLQALVYTTHTLMIRLQHQGSTTLTFGVITPQRELFVTHIGDCQVLVIRKNEFVFATQEQWLQPNMPNQMNSAFRLDPKSIHIYSFQLQKDDIVIATSDGVADNIFPEDVLQIQKRLGGDVDRLAHDLVELAVRSGNGEFGFKIPFNVKLRTEFPGKRDDSTVVVIKVQ